MTFLVILMITLLTLVLAKFSMLVIFVSLVVLGFYVLGKLLSSNPAKAKLNSCIRSDLKKRHIHSPRNPKIVRLLNQISLLHKRSSETYPVLKDKFDNIWNEVCRALEFTQDSHKLSLTLERVSNQWPLSSAPGSISNSIYEAQQAINHWNEAVKESKASRHSYRGAHQ